MKASTLHATLNLWQGLLAKLGKGVSEAEQVLLPGVYLSGLGFRPLNLGHFQVGSYRYRSLIEGVYTLYGSPIYPKLPTCSFL